MSYKDRNKQRLYQLCWVRKRRNEWIKRNGPCKLCGSKKRLQIDHINRHEKMSHRVWSWSEKRRIKELSKCQVLCRNCHFIKTTNERKLIIGELASNAKLSDKIAEHIRNLYDLGDVTMKELGAIYGVHKTTIHRIISRKSYYIK